VLQLTVAITTSCRAMLERTAQLRHCRVARKYQFPSVPHRLTAWPALTKSPTLLCAWEPTGMKRGGVCWTTDTPGFCSRQRQTIPSSVQTRISRMIPFDRPESWTEGIHVFWNCRLSWSPRCFIASRHTFATKSPFFCAIFTSEPQRQTQNSDF
jgi:hypothetical protein